MTDEPKSVPQTFDELKAENERLRTCSECGVRYDRERGALCKCGSDRLRAENERLKAELRLWKPLTPEEAERALDEAEAVPLSEERIAEIVKRATDPAERITNSEQAQLVVRLTELRRLAGELAGALERTLLLVGFGPETTEEYIRERDSIAAGKVALAAWRAFEKGET